MISPKFASKSNLLAAIAVSSLTIGLVLSNGANLPAHGQTQPATGLPATDLPATDLPSTDSPSTVPTQTVLPQAVAKKLIQQVARDTNIFRANLKITEVKARNFDGCLGIYESPNQPCSKILIRGWQAIVKSPNQTYVYHLNSNASRVIRNKTASGARPLIRVSFEPFGSFGTIDSKVIFQSSSSGDLTGRMVRTALTDDGKLTKYQSSPTARFAPVLIKTLTPEQLNSFKQALEIQRFPNLNGLSYLTSASLADYPTTTYQALNSSVQFIDLEKKSLPRSLQQVIIKWDNLNQVTNISWLKD
jgi:hypothetical protein